MNHQEFVNELVAQIESRTQNDQEVVIEFEFEDHENGEMVELFFTDVMFEDGKIKCTLSE